jgi:Icc protein
MKTSPRDQPLRLVQITDSHLCAQPGTVRNGVDVDAGLRAVIERIGREEAPDMILATGDLAHDGSAAAYRRFAGIVGELKLPVRVLPGNKDDPAVMSQTLAEWCPRVTDAGAWRLASLDSTVPGRGSGHIDGAQFAFLDHAVATAEDRHILIALHHNPVQTEPGPPDPMMLDDARIFLTHLTGWRQARVLLWGHVHQAFDCRLDNMRALAAPATGYQFKREADGKVVADDRSPGYRWLKLYDDGSIATGVKRVRLAPA